MTDHFNRKTTRLGQNAEDAERVPLLDVRTSPESPIDATSGNEVDLMGESTLDPSNSSIRVRAQTSAGNNNHNNATKASTPPPPPLTASSERIASLDHFRGFTVIMAAFVMYLGSYDWVHVVFKHNRTYFSVADSIMPQFFIAVGMGFRLTQLKAVQREGRIPALKKVLSRAGKLVFLGVYLYGILGYSRFQQLKDLGWNVLALPLKAREPFGTLMIIGLSQIYSSWIIASSPRALLLWALFSAALHCALSYAFWFEMLWEIPVYDGGSLSFLAHTIEIVAGALLYDWIKDRNKIKGYFQSYWWWMGLALGPACIMMLLGYALSCVPRGPVCYNHLDVGTKVDCPPGWFLQAAPFTEPTGPISVLTMSQRSAAISLHFFASGIGILLFVFFHLASDVFQIWPRYAITFMNHFALQSLIVYMIRDFFFNSALGIFPPDSPWWATSIGLVFMFTGLYLSVRYLCNQKLFLRL